MTFDPLEKFLGVDRSADPLQLLGLTPDRCDALAIETALHRRLAQVFSHPDGRSAEAEVARQALRAAAAALKEPARRAEILSNATPRSGPTPRAGSEAPARRQDVRRLPVNAPPIMLTAFDRQVMAALVAGGGWNAATRSRLVALAVAYGVTVDGLIKVIHGLSEYARSGGQRLSTAQITAGDQRMSPVPAAAASQTTLEWINRVAPELRGEGGAWATAKLATLSALLVVMIGAVILIAVLNGQPTIPQETPATGAAASIERTLPTVPARRTAAESKKESSAPAKFDHFPTFEESDRPAEAIESLDQSAHLPEAIAVLSRKLLISSDPSDQVFRDWRSIVETVGSCWVLLDQPALAAIDREVLELMYAAGASPAVSDRVLGAFTPTSSRLGRSIDVWRGAWMCGVLNRVASRSDLSPAMIERASNRLAVALGAEPPTGENAFEAGAAAWLHRIIGPLVDLIESDERSPQFWELWIAAQRRLSTDEQFNAALMDAIEALLASSIDFSRPSIPLNVLGRLIKTADFIESPVVRQRMEAMFIGSEATDARITGGDLWILTSLLAQSDRSQWFSEELVVPQDATDSHRRRKWARIAEAWPASAANRQPGFETARPTPVDPHAATQWVALHERCLAELKRRDSAGQMSQLVNACWLNETAARLAANQPIAAQAVMERLAKNLDRATGGQEYAFAAVTVADPSAAPGQAIGPDGQWAAALQGASNNADALVQQLEALRRSAGTDLGPIDAQALVREAYRGRSLDLRSQAQSIIASQFSRGPNVVLAMLDQLPDAPVTEQLSETIGRVTLRVLPGARSTSWAMESRLALVERVQDLRHWPAGMVDVAEREAALSLSSQLAALRGEESASQTDERPQEVSRRLFEAWQAAAGRLPTSAPTPAALPALATRHRTRLGLAYGPIEVFVANRLAALDLLTYIAVAEQPALRTPAMALLSESARKRSGMTTVLDQALEVELTMGRIWRLRLVADQSNRPAAERRP